MLVEMKFYINLTSRRHVQVRDVTYKGLSRH